MERRLQAKADPTKRQRQRPSSPFAVDHAEYAPLGGVVNAYNLDFDQKGTLLDFYERVWKPFGEGLTEMEWKGIGLDLVSNEN